jgi:hypothetical protein
MEAMGVEKRVSGWGHFMIITIHCGLKFFLSLKINFKFLPFFIFYFLGVENGGEEIQKNFLELKTLRLKGIVLSFGFDHLVV